MFDWPSEGFLTPIDGGWSWAKLLPGSGGALLIYGSSSATYASVVAIPAPSPDGSSTAEQLSAEHVSAPVNLSGVIGAMDAARVAASPTGDHYAVVHASNSYDSPSPVAKVTHLSIVAGQVVQHETSTFAGRWIDQVYSSAEARFGGDGATGPLLLLRRAQVEGGAALQRVTVAGAALAFSDPRPIQLEEVYTFSSVSNQPVFDDSIGNWRDTITTGTTAWLVPHDLSLFAVGSDYGLIVKGPQVGYNMDGSDTYYDSQPTYGGAIFGRTSLEVIDSKTMLSRGEASLPAGSTRMQFAGGGTLGDLDGSGHVGTEDDTLTGKLFMYGGNTQTRGYRQYWTSFPDAGDVIYMNRFVYTTPPRHETVDYWGDRELVALRLHPGGTAVSRHDPSLWSRFVEASYNNGGFATDAEKTAWVICSCGWQSPVFSDPDRYSDEPNRLSRQAWIAHVAQVNGGASITIEASDGAQYMVRCNKRDSPILATSGMGVALIYTGPDNYVHSGGLILDVLGGETQALGKYPASSLVRTGIEGLVQQPGCFLTMDLPSDGKVYLGQVLGFFPQPDASGVLKATGSVFRSPRG